MRGVAKKIAPLLDRILVRKIRPLEKTAGGILIPEQARKTGHARGEVIAVGPGGAGEKEQVTLKTGDVVILPSYGGTEIEYGDNNDDSYVLLRESEILAKEL